MKLLWILVAGMLVAGCGRKAPHGVDPHLDSEQFPARLSEWGLFTADFKPAAGVLVYDVNTPLFSNHADKLRTVWMPAGTPAKYKATGVFDLPVGAILSKTFSFGARRIETRLFVHRKPGWQGVTYVWSQDQRDADLSVTPAPVPVEWKGQRFDYGIPNVNQCKTCHEGPEDNGPLGVTAKQLNRGGQLAEWVRAGYLREVEANPPVTGTDLESRARDYLDANCASCHVVGGRGMKSGIFLTEGETDRRNLGVCRKDVIVPGKPEGSKMIERMRSLDPKVMMPDLGHSVVDEEGVELIREWIAGMKGNCPV